LHETPKPDSNHRHRFGGLFWLATAPKLHHSVAWAACTCGLSNTRYTATSHTHATYALNANPNTAHTHNPNKSTHLESNHAHQPTCLNPNNDPNHTDNTLDPNHGCHLGLPRSQPDRT
jgi:hypothetical protein